MEEKLTACGTCLFFLKHPNRDEPHSYCRLKQVRVHASETCDEWQPNNLKDKVKISVPEEAKYLRQSSEKETSEEEYLKYEDGGES